MTDWLLMTRLRQIKNEVVDSRDDPSTTQEKVLTLLEKLVDAITVSERRKED